MLAPTNIYNYNILHPSRKRKKHFFLKNDANRESRLEFAIAIETIYVYHYISKRIYHEKIKNLCIALGGSLLDCLYGTQHFF